MNKTLPTKVLQHRSPTEIHSGAFLGWTPTVPQKNRTAELPELFVCEAWYAEDETEAIEQECQEIMEWLNGDTCGTRR